MKTKMSFLVVVAECYGVRPHGNLLSMKAVPIFLLALMTGCACVECYANAMGSDPMVTSASA